MRSPYYIYTSEYVFYEDDLCYYRGYLYFWRYKRFNGYYILHQFFPHYLLTVIVGIFCTNFCSSKSSAPHLSAQLLLSATSCWSALLFLASLKPYLLYLPLLSLYHILYYIKNPQVASNRESDTCGKLFWLWTCHARRVMTNLAKTGSPFRLGLKPRGTKIHFCVPGARKGRNPKPTRYCDTTQRTEYPLYLL